LQIIGGVGVHIRVEFYKGRHGARDERQRWGKVVVWGYDERLDLR
jgi:hypothetical protein